MRKTEHSAAQAAGLKRFESAFPCKKCGGVLFRISRPSGKCVACEELKQKLARSTEDGKRKASAAALRTHYKRAESVEIRAERSKRSALFDKE